MNDIKQLVERFRQSPLIKETCYENISAFNFTRKAFNRADWNDLTTRARGMFINTEKNRIICRGYDKFFQVDERPETKKEHLRTQRFQTRTAKALIVGRDNGSCGKNENYTISKEKNNVRYDQECPECTRR